MLVPFVLVLFGLRGSLCCFSTPLVCSLDPDDLIAAASWQGDNTKVKFLLDCGSVVDAYGYSTAPKGLVALVEAAREGQELIVKTLLENGASANVQDGSGITALMRASQYGHLNIASQLIRAGANVNYKNPMGWVMAKEYRRTPLHAAAYNGYTDIVELLLENGATADLYDGNLDKEKNRYGDGPGDTPLMLAASQGNVKIVTILLKHKVDVNKQNSRGVEKTALILAAEQGSLEIVSALLDNGALVDMKDSNGNTALVRAALFGHLDVAKFLLSKSAQVDAKDSLDETALMMAVKFGNGWKRRDDGFYGNREMVLTLIEAGANVNEVEWNGRTALNKAARRNVDPDVISILLNYGADVEIKDDKGMTALITAALLNFTTTATILLEYGASVDVRDNEGRTALMLAAGKEMSRVVPSLLQYNATVDLQDKAGRTAMMYAASTGSAGTVTLLLEKGANHLIKDNENKKALDIAQGAGGPVYAVLYQKTMEALN